MYICMYICMYVYMYVYTYVNMCVYMYVNIYLYIYINHIPMYDIHYIIDTLVLGSSFMNPRWVHPTSQRMKPSYLTKTRDITYFVSGMNPKVMHPNIVHSMYMSDIVWLMTNVKQNGRLNVWCILIIVLAINEG